MQNTNFAVLVRRLILVAMVWIFPVVLGGAFAAMLQRPDPTAVVVTTSDAHHVALGSDFWHTRGGTIRDSDNHLVRIAGLNWSGLETAAAVPGGLMTRDYHAILHSVAAAGYNTIRLPFSNQAIETPVHPSAIAFQSSEGPINQELRGLNSLEIMDAIIAAAGQAGLRVILDDHRSEAGSSAEESGLWYTSDYPEQRWIADWTALAYRYRSNPTVVGFDLRNEPHNSTSRGACWSCGGTRDWHLAAERAGNAVLHVNPNLLIFVEGTDTVDGNTYWWGGNLAGVRSAPVRLFLRNHLVYSPHVYGPTEYPQPWFNSSTSPSSLSSIWRARWAFIAEENLAPIFLGEFGATNDASTLDSVAPGSEGQWFRTLVDFLNVHPAIGWAYWSLNGEDRYALLDNTYSFRASNRQKLTALSKIARVGSNVEHLPSQAGRLEHVAKARCTPGNLCDRHRHPSWQKRDVTNAIAAEIRLAVLRTAYLSPPSAKPVGVRSPHASKSIP